MQNCSKIHNKASTIFGRTMKKSVRYIVEKTYLAKHNEQLDKKLGLLILTLFMLDRVVELNSKLCGLFE